MQVGRNIIKLDLWIWRINITHYYIVNLRLATITIETWFLQQEILRAILIKIAFVCR